MRQTVLFLSRFWISLWTVITISFLSLLIFNAPNVPNTAPFVSISIAAGNGSTLYLPNRIFDCAETDQQFQCQTKIQNRLLNLTLTKGSNYKYDLSNCRALYDKQPIGCQETGQTYAPILAKMYEVTDLKLTPQELQAVQQKYWGINTLIQLGELRLMWISMGLSLAAGLGAAFLAWLHPGKFSKAVASLACGFGMYQFAWSLLGRVQYDVVTPYGITSDNWDWVVNGGAIGIGIGTIFVTAFLLWRSSNRFIRILISVITSIGIFSLCWLSLIWIFNSLSSLFNSTEILFPNEYLTTWFLPAISFVFAIITAILLCLRTHESLKKFLCLVNGIGVVALATNFFVLVLLGLGYAD